MRQREVADPGPGPHRTDAADAAKQIERCTHDYKRHGTTILFAALEIETGQVTTAVKPRHRHQEFLAFLRQINRTYPGQKLHLVTG